MKLSKINFDEVSIKGRRKYIDSATGKKRQETRKFFQTVNPFNRDEKTGLAKSREQILGELRAECDAWMSTGASQ